jgi:hypothetical protein
MWFSGVGIVVELRRPPERFRENHRRVYAAIQNPIAIARGKQRVPQRRKK